MPTYEKEGLGNTPLTGGAVEDTSEFVSGFKEANYVSDVHLAFTSDSTTSLERQEEGLIASDFSAGGTWVRERAREGLADSDFSAGGEKIRERAREGLVDSDFSASAVDENEFVEEGTAPLSPFSAEAFLDSDLNKEGLSSSSFNSTAFIEFELNKEGLASFDFSASGGKLKERSTAEVVVSDFSAGGERIKERAPEGLVESTFRASGVEDTSEFVSGFKEANLFDDVHLVFKAEGFIEIDHSREGIATSSFTTSGGKETDLEKTGIAQSEFSAGGVRIRERAPEGLGSAVLSGTVASVVTYVERGTAIRNDTIGAGRDIDQFTKKNIGISPRVASGAKVRDRPRIGTVYSYFGGSGSRSVDAYKTGLAVTSFASSIARLTGKESFFTVPTTLPVYPITTILGTYSNPFITNLRTGEELRFYNLSATNGQQLVINHRARSVKLDGIPVYSYSGNFFQIREANEMFAGAASVGTGFAVNMETPAIGGSRRKVKYAAGVMPHAVLSDANIQISRAGIGNIPLVGSGPESMNWYTGAAISSFRGSGFTPLTNALFETPVIVTPPTQGNETQVPGPTPPWMVSSGYFPTSNRPFLSDPAAHILWYSLTPTSTETYYVNYSSYYSPEPGLGIYTGADVTVLTSIFEAEEGIFSFYNGSLTSGITYHIAVKRVSTPPISEAFTLGVTNP